MCFFIFKEFRKRSTHFSHLIPHGKLKDEEEKIKVDQEFAQNPV